MSETKEGNPEVQDLSDSEFGSPKAISAATKYQQAFTFVNNVESSPEELYYDSRGSQRKQLRNSNRKVL
jgi:hypothetical protein